MKPALAEFSRRYGAMLRAHLKRRRPTLRPAKELGRRAITMGLETLDLARIHERTLMKLLISPSSASTRRDGIIRRAGLFFAEATIPIEKTHGPARIASAHLNRMIQTLTERGMSLATSNHRLKQETAQRRLAEEALRKSELHYGLLLEQSRHMQEQLRLLSRQLLSAQEEERKKISRELHDVIAQTLTSINIQLATLRREATLDSKGLERKIARTQQMVEKSVNLVHRFARELRPTILDDLGLIPALTTYMKNFREETGIQVSLSAFAGVDQVNGDKRTVLYRVAQEALTNVARHAQASQADVKIQKLNGAIFMKIKDNGKGFQEERVLRAKKGKRLGLLGMRERVEMVGGNFAIESAPGKGTAVLAQLPLGGGRGGEGALISKLKPGRS